MDHLVLIPQDFNLVVTSEKLPQDNVTVWSNQRIAQGTIYYPFQGTVRIDKLNVFSTASEDDVSLQSSHENGIMLIESNYELMFHETCSFKGCAREMSLRKSLSHDSENFKKVSFEKITKP